MINVQENLLPNNILGDNTNFMKTSGNRGIHLFLNGLVIDFVYDGTPIRKLSRASTNGDLCLGFGKMFCN